MDKEIRTVGKLLGCGGHAQVHEAKDADGRILALKLYRDKNYFTREYDAYKHLRRSDTFPHTKLPQYFGHFELSQSLISTFYFYPDDYEVHKRISPPDPYKRALGIEIFNGVGFDTISKDDLEDEWLAKFESDLTQTVRAFHDAGVCHGDIKADNILVDPRILKGSKQVEREYIVIDLSAAVLKHKVSENIWKKLQKRDLSCTRVIFETIKAQKALTSGLELISKISLSKSNEDMTKQPIDTETQSELVDLFKAANYARKASFFIDGMYQKLVDAIVQKTDLLTPELCFIVVECLVRRGRGRQALSLVNKTLSQPLQTPCPELNRHKALLMTKTSVDSTITAQAFELAIAEYTEKYGPHRLLTLEAQMEFANFLAKIQSHSKAKEIIEDILLILKSPDIQRSERVIRLERDCSIRIRHIDNELAKSQQPIQQPPMNSLKRKLSTSDTDFGEAHRSPERL
ncbi:5ec3d1ec-c06e-4f8f-bdde-6ff63ac63a3e [Sclerotinia trifoliorum]|uniref:5ec3d1ec-c06e-4f8f-bdde-6ff63ac63a3e n=1 Tax=Sclerotinia trifoliorum TaxID=28548 RepID=A0A8H2VU60_9HELO|nr:5ec3d1ec-c06e-4f8f-bdde-6ff63ac63a3e [Sclerotinia trifoliorum]